MSNANYPVCQLTKREPIAAMVLQGFAADTGNSSMREVVAGAVEWTDALLAELERTA